MLKIKDSVDLKELEKFGFIQNEYKEYENPDIADVFVRENKELVLDFGFNNENIMLLYDLIQAGLVEKVGDNQ